MILGLLISLPVHSLCQSCLSCSLVQLLSLSSCFIWLSVVLCVVIPDLFLVCLPPVCPSPHYLVYKLSKAPFALCCNLILFPFSLAFVTVPCTCNYVAGTGNITMFMHQQASGIILAGYLIIGRVYFKLVVKYEF